MFLLFLFFLWGGYVFVFFGFFCLFKEGPLLLEGCGENGDVVLVFFSLTGWGKWGG